MHRSQPALRRARARGTTLIEVLIVVAIMSLIAAGAVVAIMPRWREAQIRTTETNAKSLRTAVGLWQGAHAAGDCPTTSQLLSDRYLDKAGKAEDAWGTPYKVVCANDDVTVVSSGPDKRDGTGDDIVVPSDTKPRGAL